MKVRSVAAPSRESNAVGSLELECTPAGLTLVYLAISSYSRGYAPGVTAKSSRVTVAWPSVISIDNTELGVVLKLAPEITPHHSLFLTRFSEGDGPSPEELKRRRWIARIALAAACVALFVALPGAIAIATGGPARAAMAISVVAAICLMALGFVAERIWLRPTRSSEEIQSALIATLKHYRPSPLRAGAPKVPQEQAASLQELINAIPRSTGAIIIVLTAGSLAAILTSNWIIRGPGERPAAQLAPTPKPKVAPIPLEPKVMATTSAASPPPPATTASAPAVASASDRAECSCERSDSVLWRHPFPQMSTLLIAQRLRAHKQHHHVELELGLVNNSNVPLKEASLTVRFFEDKGQKHTKDRPLFYEGTLRPGQAIKWHVEARGTSFVVDNPRKKLLSHEELAGAEAFASLLKANHRPVRLHGAMMLAYHRDQRARQGALALREALREEEAPYLDRVIAVQKDVIACDLRVAAEGRHREVDACIYNTSPKTLKELGLKVRALDRGFDHRNPVAPPPQVLAEKVWALPGEFGPRSGRWVSVNLDTDSATGKLPKEFEAFVDRYDVLE